MADSLTNKKGTAPPGIAVRAALALRRTFQRAADAVVPPQIAAFEHMSGAARTMVVGEIARLRIADLVEQRPQTAQEIATTTEKNPDAMMRLLRGAVTLGFFERDSNGRFSNNRLSRALMAGDLESSRAMAEYFASRSNMLAWADFPETVRTGKNAFDRVHGKSVWAWFDEHPHELETFAQAMMTLTLVDAPGIAKAYPFSEVTRICDVGGGRGTLLGELLVHHPHLRAVLADAPGVLESAKPLLAQREVLDRVELVPGSFFESVPKGCDAYILKNILHDWDDARSLAILKNCRAAMEPGTRVLVIEAIVEEDTEELTVLSDLQMMVVCGEGRERGRLDFARLLGASGFRLSRVIEAPTLVAIVEGIAI